MKPHQETSSWNVWIVKIKLRIAKEAVKMLVLSKSVSKRKIRAKPAQSYACSFQGGLQSRRPSRPTSPKYQSATRGTIESNIGVCLRLWKMQCSRLELHVDLSCLSIWEESQRQLGKRRPVSVRMYKGRLRDRSQLPESDHQERPPLVPCAREQRTETRLSEERQVVVSTILWLMPRCWSERRIDLARPLRTACWWVMCNSTRPR